MTLLPRQHRRTSRTFGVNVSARCAAVTNHPDALPQDKIIGEAFNLLRGRMIGAMRWRLSKIFLAVNLSRLVNLDVVLLSFEVHAELTTGYWD